MVGLFFIFTIGTFLADMGTILNVLLDTGIILAGTLGVLVALEWLRDRGSNPFDETLPEISGKDLTERLEERYYEAIKENRGRHRKGG